MNALRDFLIPSIALPALLAFGLAGRTAAELDDWTALLKIQDGILVIWNGRHHHFTLQLKGRKIQSLDSEAHFFVSIDGTPFHVQSVAVGQFLKENAKVASPAAQVLQAHQSWESLNIEDSLKAKLETESFWVDLKDGEVALLWKYDLPEGMDQEVKSQVYLTRLDGGHLLVLKSSVTRGKSEEKVCQHLIASAETFQPSADRIDLKELQKALRKGSAPPPAVQPSPRRSSGPTNDHLDLHAASAMRRPSNAALTIPPA